MRRCIDQIFTMQQVCEKVIEKEKSIVMACVELEKRTIKWIERNCGKGSMVSGDHY